MCNVLWMASCGIRDVVAACAALLVGVMVHCVAMAMGGGKVKFRCKKKYAMMCS